MPNPGYDTYIVDEQFAGADPTATDTLFLLTTDGPESPTVTKRADTDSDELNAKIRAYFSDGGRALVLQGYGETSDAFPTLSEAVAGLPAGPGQIVAPEVVTAEDAITVVDGGWAQNKVTILNGADDDTDQDLEALAAAVITDSTGGRGGSLSADVGIWPGLLPNTTDHVPWSITVAALIAAQDRLTGNPGRAAAGKRGISNADGVVSLRSDDAREALKDAQVNTAKLVGGKYRNYGIRSLADLDEIPLWWNFWASRVIMAYRARAGSIAEDFAFEQIDGESKLIGRFGDRLKAEAKVLADLGALFKGPNDPGYRIDTGPEVNPLEELQAGELQANAYLRTSENAEHIVINLIRRALTATV